MAVANLVEQLTRLHPFTVAVVIGGILVFFVFLRTDAKRKSGNPQHPPLPAVPGLPVLGNLLQLKEKKPHKTFAAWAETYGPIYSIRTGSSTVVVINSTDVAREAMATKHASISTRKLPNAIKILTLDKFLVAASDYNDFHRTTKRCLLSSVLGANAQKRHRVHRDAMMENMIEKLEGSQEHEVNFREFFEPELFALALKQAIGGDVESIYVDEIATTLTRSELYDVMVTDPMNGAIDVDWRDFFPNLKWIPNRRLERKIWRIHTRRLAVMKALIREQKRRIADGERRSCYLDFLLVDGDVTLSEEQIAVLVWEAIIESSDTVSVTTEWAMYELADDRSKQEILFLEMENLCGSAKMIEENLPHLPYLNAVFHETLRKHSPVPLIPLRYVHDDVFLGGFHVPAGSEIAVNIYGCNMDGKVWKDPGEWKPERFMEGKCDGGDLYKTMSFGAGKRACAGSLQAMLISCTSIGRFVQRFEWSLGEGEEGNVNTGCLTTRKLQPLRLITNPRTPRSSSVKIF